MGLAYPKVDTKAAPYDYETNLQEFPEATDVEDYFESVDYFYINPWEDCKVTITVYFPKAEEVPGVDFAEAMAAAFT